MGIDNIRYLSWLFNKNNGSFFVYLWMIIRLNSNSSRIKNNQFPNQYFTIRHSENGILFWLNAYNRLEWIRNGNISLKIDREKG